MQAYSTVHEATRDHFRPMGVIANNPHHLPGAIDSDSADKGARFMQLCDAFDIPILSLMDCPGVMVGPDVERTGLVRHSARMFNTGANLTTPLFGVVIRKVYGLGVPAMCGGNSLFGFFMVAWPTAEFAAMNIEGSVKLGYRKELMAIADLEERQKFFDEKVERAYNDAKAVNGAMGVCGARPTRVFTRVYQRKNKLLYLNKSG